MASSRVDRSTAASSWPRNSASWPSRKLARRVRGSRASAQRQLRLGERLHLQANHQLRGDDVRRSGVGGDAECLGQCGTRAGGMAGLDIGLAQGEVQFEIVRHRRARPLEPGNGIGEPAFEVQREPQHLLRLTPLDRVRRAAARARARAARSPRAGDRRDTAPRR